MPLAAGTRFGPYEIAEPLGAGGMGEVYRARDTELNRHVAIKVLPELFAADPDRLARFAREAQTLASLNHPHIAQIYGVVDAPGAGGRATRALVMELVDGDDLAMRLGRGPIPPDEALPIARQIAEALEAAHEQGIVHRDLKPANIKVKPDGVVKVLDFGLAKLSVPDQSGVASAPTLTSPATAIGTILGTAAYMAPEQARGGVVDKRADIWAFGCVLFEVLSGRRPFDSSTVPDVLAAVLTRDPDWSLLPRTTPPGVRHLLVRCLERDPKRRLRDIGEARLALEHPTKTPMTPVETGVSAPPLWRWALPWGIAALMSGVSVVEVWRSRPVPNVPRQIVRFAVALPPPETIAFEELGDIPAVALSPDGSRLVYVGRRDRTSQLYIRQLDSFESRAIPGTERARGPFFSPDGEWVGFFTETGLMKAPLRGGAPQLIYPSPPVPRGAAWGAEDTIVFAPQQATGITVVSAVGRPPALPGAAARTPVVGPEGLPRLTTPDVGSGERAHLWPEILPGGKAVVFTVATGANIDDSSIVVQSFETGARQTVIKGGSQARYASTGHLVYARGGALLAVPFDLSRLETTAPPMTVVEGVRLDPRTGAAQFSISSSGTLAYVPGTRTSPDRTLVWVDRSGNAKPVNATRAGYSYLTLSPDGRRLAYTLQGANQDLWVYDLDRAVQTRLTFGPAENWGAVWTPDSKRLVFSMHGPHHPNLFWMAADGSGTPERLTTGTNPHFAGGVSPDGSMLAFTGVAEKTGNDIWLLPLTGERQARLMIGTPFDEYSPAWSADGKWLAYVSTESGRPEVFVQPYPGPGAKRQVSVDGGVAPVWGRDTREIFYRNGDRVMAVAFAEGPDFTPTPARVLFEGSFEEYGLPHWGRNYDVTNGSQQFVMVAGSKEPPATRINVVVNWVEELRKTLTAER